MGQRAWLGLLLLAAGGYSCTTTRVAVMDGNGNLYLNRDTWFFFYLEDSILRCVETPKGLRCKEVEVEMAVLDVPASCSKPGCPSSSASTLPASLPSPAPASTGAGRSSPRAEPAKPVGDEGPNCLSACKLYATGRSAKENVPAATLMYGCTQRCESEAREDAGFRVCILRALNEKQAADCGAL